MEGEDVVVFSGYASDGQAFVYAWIGGEGLRCEGCWGQRDYCG